MRQSIRRQIQKIINDQDIHIDNLQRILHRRQKRLDELQERYKRQVKTCYDIINAVNESQLRQYLIPTLSFQEDGMLLQDDPLAKSGYTVKERCPNAPVEGG